MLGDRQEGLSLRKNKCQCSSWSWLQPSGSTSSLLLLCPTWFVRSLARTPRRRYAKRRRRRTREYSTIGSTGGFLFAAPPGNCGSSYCSYNARGSSAIQRIQRNFGSSYCSLATVEESSSAVQRNVREFDTQKRQYGGSPERSYTGKQTMQSTLSYQVSLLCPPCILIVSPEPSVVAFAATTPGPSNTGVVNDFHNFKTEADAQVVGMKGSPLWMRRLAAVQDARHSEARRVTTNPLHTLLVSVVCQPYLFSSASW